MTLEAKTQDFGSTGPPLGPVDPFVQDVCDDELARCIGGECVNDQDRALSVLSVAVDLFEDMQKGCSLEKRHTHLEEVSKLTGVSPPIILYAYKNGTLRAHDLFVKEELKGNNAGGVGSDGVDAPMNEKGST